VPVLALPEVDVSVEVEGAGAATLPLLEVEVLTSPLEEGWVESLRSVASPEVLERCMLLESVLSLRPCGSIAFLWCFLCFAPVVAAPVAELSDRELVAFESVEVLGSELVVPDCVELELEMPAVPLSSPVVLLVAAGLLFVLLVSVDVVCARAPTADRAIASAALRMIFTLPPPWV
jgi:hypothetical protein